MNLKSFVFNPFYENTYVIWDNDGVAAIIDPGCYEAYEVNELKDFIEENNLEVVSVLNTHCHIDHVLGNYAVTQVYQCPLRIPKLELENYRAVQAYAPQWGIQRYTEVEPSDFLEPGEDLRIGNLIFHVRFTPGHSPGHVVFYQKDENKLIGGDVLFRGSMGRTDLPGGDHERLLRSIREELYTLPGETEVFPGHGDPTTIAYERTNNPFVRM